VEVTEEKAASSLAMDQLRLERAWGMNRPDGMRWVEWWMIWEYIRWWMVVIIFTLTCPDPATGLSLSLVLPLSLPLSVILSFFKPFAFSTSSSFSLSFAMIVAYEWRKLARHCSFHSFNRSGWVTMNSAKLKNKSWWWYKRPAYARDKLLKSWGLKESKSLRSMMLVPIDWNNCWRIDSFQMLIWRSSMAQTKFAKACGAADWRMLGWRKCSTSEIKTRRTNEEGDEDEESDGNGGAKGDGDREVELETGSCSFANE